MATAIAQPVGRHEVSPRAGWLLVIVAVIASYIVLPSYLVTATPIGSLKGDVALMVEAGVLARALVGVLRNRPGRAWAFYLVLMVLLPVLIAGLAAYAA